jgi:hypothetical protein
MAVQRIIGRIQIEHDLPRRHRMRLEEQLDEQPLDRRRLGPDLVLATHARERVQLEAVERALAGQRRAAPMALRRQLPQQRAHHRIVAQPLVIVQILVAERHAKHPLPEQRAHRMLDRILSAFIDETARQPVDHTDRCIRLAEQQRPGVGSDRATIQRRHDAAPFHT